jgi:hypothetical protein
MLILGVILLAEAMLLLIITPILWQQIIGGISLVWASGMIGLWIWDNRGKDERL